MVFIQLQILLIRQYLKDYYHGQLQCHLYYVSNEE